MIKLCENHQQMIMTAVKKHGMEHLVSENAKDGVVRTAKFITTHNFDDIDPVCLTTVMVSNAAKDDFEIDLTEEHSMICPVCEAVKRGEEETEWTEEPVKAIKGIIEAGSLQLQQRLMTLMGKH